MKKAVIGIDVGTSGVKVLAMDENCKVVCSVTETYPLYMPEEGWTEQNPVDWWNATVKCLGIIVPQIKEYELCGVGLSGQMHGMVALDKNNEVVRPAILWNDQRTVSQCEEIISLAGGREALASYTDNNMLTGFTGGKILWMKENEPDNYAKTVKIINPKDYILFRLTGAISTDLSDASGTGLFDVKNGRFSSELIEKIGLSPSLFAEPLFSGDVAGYVNTDCGLPAGLAVFAGGGDAVLSTIAMGAGGGGSVGVMLGTSGVVSVHTDEFRDNRDGSIQFSRSCVKGKYHAMGVTLAAAGSEQWFADTLGDGNFKECDRIAAESGIGSGGVVFLPYISGERCPINDPAARGCFVGISAKTTKGDLARAVLEGVAFSLRQVYEKLDPSKNSKRIVLAGGGSKSPLWRKIISAVFGRETVMLDGAGEGSGYGAAIVAGVGCGMLPSAEEAMNSLSVRTTDVPNASDVAEYEKAYKRYLSLYPRLKGF
ncbi:MAG: xylulokinase [Clostridia bacterium]|nr:xylulokinase [Clostridia bacterium]